MVIIKRKKCVYYIKEEEVVMEYNNQFASFNVYALQSRKKFKDYKLELMESKRDQFDNINDAIGLARKHGLISGVGFCPTLSKEDTYIK